MLINELYKNGMENTVTYILDSHISKAGSCYRGYRIFYPSKAKTEETDMILICTTKYEDEIYDFLRKEGVRKEIVYRITDYMK